MSSATPGGVVSDDVIRSLSISQRLLGTARNHPRSSHGLRDVDVPRRRTEGADRRGHRHSPAVRACEAFADVDADVRQSMLRTKASHFIPRKEVVRGFVYEVEKGSAARGHLTPEARRKRNLAEAAKPGSPAALPRAAT